MHQRGDSEARAVEGQEPVEARLADAREEGPGQQVDRQPWAPLSHDAVRAGDGRHGHGAREAARKPGREGAHLEG